MFVVKKGRTLHLEPIQSGTQQFEEMKNRNENWISSIFGERLSSNQWHVSHNSPYMYNI